MTQIKFIRIAADKPLGKVPKTKILEKAMGDSRSWEKPEGALDKLQNLFRKAKWRDHKGLEYYIDLVAKQPANTFARLRLAEIYQERGEKKKAILEYFRTAEVFSRKRLYPQAIAIYKRIQKQDPTLFQVYPKFAEICRKMGFQEETTSPPPPNGSQRTKENTWKVTGGMAESRPPSILAEEKAQSLKEIARVQKKGGNRGLTRTPEVPFPAQEKTEVLFDLGAELEVSEPPEYKDFEEVKGQNFFHGFEEILKELKGMNISSKNYPNFNYNMGVACKEMGFTDEAIEQFHIALEEAQRPFEAAYLLGLCLLDKGQKNEARQSFEKALKVKGVPREKVMEVKMALTRMEQKREEVTPGFRKVNKVGGQEGKVSSRYQNKKMEFAKLGSSLIVSPRMNNPTR
jgi:tetratricopeptide (TPR) repeat protein